MSNIDGLLDDIRTAVCSGKFQELSILTALVEAAISADDFIPSQSILQKSKRNSQLLEAAIAGVRSARRRLNEIDDATKGLSTYDASGSRLILNQKGAGDRRL